jgi:phosphate-selective porin OprO/OprP
MKLAKKTLLALGGYGALAAASPHAWADATEDRMQAMERRLLELESRLERSEQENARLRKAGLQAETAAPAQAQKAPGEALGTLNAKLATLETKLEQDRKTAAEAAKNAPKIEMGAGGLTVKSADEQFRLNLRGYAQADGNFFMDDSSGDKIADNFSIRRARLTLDGTAFKWVDFRFSPDFGQGNLRLFDAYVDLHYFSYASLMAGKFRSPINGLERQQGAPNLTFIERGLTQNLTPARDIGVMLHGELPYPGYKPQYAMPPVFKEFAGYQLGVFNGGRDGGNADSDKDDNKEFAGRVFAHPFLHSGIQPLQGLGLGLAGSWGHPRDNALNTLKTAGQQAFLSYKNGVTATGYAYRITPGAYWYYGPLGVLAEYVISSQQLKSGANTARQDNKAWQVLASYMLTGEDNSFQGIKPLHPFDPFAGTWGALQVAARWGELEVDADTFNFKGAFADPATSARKATEWALGLNWWLNTNIRLMSDYAQTYFLGGAAHGRDRPVEKVFQTRFQYQF